MTIDCIQRKTTGTKHGIQLMIFNQLEDMDFADDVAEISTRQHLQDKTTSLIDYAEQTGLKINTAKTKMMVINNKLADPITINNNLVDTIEDFIYLGSIISADILHIPSKVLIYYLEQIPHQLLKTFSAISLAL
jgi:hypothetical protein